MLDWIYAFLVGGAVLTAPAGEYQLIDGRDDGTPPYEREAIYRMAIPPEWKRIDPSPDASILDSREALCTFTIPDEAGDLTLVIHNFPSQDLSDRIPAQAQVDRWLKQFTVLDPLTNRVTPQAFSGFEGLCVEASGQRLGQELALLGWALSLNVQHYRVLSRPDSSQWSAKKRAQMRGDVTLKVTGPIEAMNVHREEIRNAARTFELTHPIPEPQ